jgi:hypothetical protein
MATSTVRIGPETRLVLKELSARTGESARVILRKALEEFRRKCFLEEANRAYAALRQDKKAWKAELAERRVWDSTLGDESKGR